MCLKLMITFISTQIFNGKYRRACTVYPTKQQERRHQVLQGTWAQSHFSLELLSLQGSLSWKYLALSLPEVLSCYYSSADEAEYLQRPWLLPDTYKVRSKTQVS